jgi:DNA-binding NtrC family response regulator
MSDDPLRQAQGRCLAPALVCLWSHDQPQCVGECALLEPAVHSEWVMGRGARCADDPAERLVFIRQQPGENLAGSPLAGISISRLQLRLRLGDGGLIVENVGMGTVLVDGVALPRGGRRTIQPGGVIQIVGNAIFLFVMRPLSLAATKLAFGPPHTFGRPDPDGMAGESPLAWALRAVLSQANLAGGHMLILGETGTGKELAANALHRLSLRSGVLLAYNAASLTLSLAESELFGNPRGYPNPETPERPGLFGQTQKGTLFLDEIGALLAAGQSVLLRVLAEGKYLRQGESVPRPLDVRVVCATNEGEISLRRDVLKRFSYVIYMPRLKDRLEDLPLIARALVLKIAVENPALAGSFVTPGPDGSPQAKLAPALILQLLRCALDGNVRDVRNVLLRGMAESHGLPAIMPPEDMTPWLPHAPVPPSPASTERIEAEVADLMAGLGQVKPPVPAKGRLLEGLERTGWQIEATGTYLGISRHAVKRLMKKYGIRRPGEPEAKPGGDPDDDVEDDPQ